jgi:hypothetical protein
MREDLPAVGTAELLALLSKHQTSVKKPLRFENSRRFNFGIMGGGEPQAA